MRPQQTGVAVVLAMGVVALAAIAAAAILGSQSKWMRYSELTADHVQARAILIAGADWARALLADDRRTSSIDHPGEPWALRTPPMSVESGELLGHIDDQQGVFNVNNLVIDGKLDLTQLAHFRRLLVILGLPSALADALLDWIDEDAEPQPNFGAEDEYYRSLNPPYLTANRPLLEVSELALVRGFDENVRARLRPYITALPRFTAINVNTVSAEVLAAVVPGLDVGSAEVLVAQRQRAYYQSTEDFVRRLPQGASAAAKDLSVSSDYFLATLRVRIGGAQALGKALLARAGAEWPTIVWRKYL